MNRKIIQLAIICIGVLIAFLAIRLNAREVQDSPRDWTNFKETYIFQ